jgi:hypothetical protein
MSMNLILTIDNKEVDIIQTSSDITAFVLDIDDFSKHDPNVGFDPIRLLNNNDIHTRMRMYLESQFKSSFPEYKKMYEDEAIMIYQAIENNQLVELTYR